MTHQSAQEKGYLVFKFGAIADDFTGATDLAGLMARTGHRVSLRIGIPQASDISTADIEIIALKIRNIAPSDAQHQAGMAFDWLQAQGASRYYWKYCSTFDSTDLGNIGPVATYLMDRIGTEKTIYCPSFPENGRRVFMGNMFVGQTPLGESPMKNHPLTPMRDSNLLRVLAPQVGTDVGLVDVTTLGHGPDAVRGAIRGGNFAHFIMDTVDNNDLETIAQACHDMPLITGGSALAFYLPNLYQGNAQSPDPAPTPKTNGKSIILSGSCSEMTNAQVAAYRATGRPCLQIDPVDLAENGVSPVLDWLGKQDLQNAPMIFATTDADGIARAQSTLGRDHAGALVETALADCATLAHQMGAERIIVAGGETSGAVTTALNITQLDVRQEICPGVPWCFATTSQGSTAIALKSGNFGTADFFTAALDTLDRL